MSLNTTFYALTQKVGAEKVLETAKAAGITNPKVDGNLSVTRQVALGDLRITPLDHANGFATLAAKGREAPTYFVERVERDGAELYKHPQPVLTQAIPADVAADTTYALRQVYNAGRRIADGRAGAGKTGTAQLGKTSENSDAWMVGYTPQLSAAVWVGHSAADAKLRNAKTGMSVYGNGLPRDFWAEFMSAALEGAPRLDFPPPVYTGQIDAGNVASPAPSPSPSILPTQSPSPRPTQAPPEWPVPSDDPAPSPDASTSPSPDPLFPSNTGPSDPQTG
jgi:membrane peptidoglycan carboxypeptidase